MVDSDQFFNIILVGDNKTGKSSIVSRYTRNFYTEAHNIKNLGKVIVSTFYHDDFCFTLHFSIFSLHDLQKSKAIHRIECNLRKANVVFAVFDKSRKKTFSRLKKILSEIQDKTSNDALIIIVGNMCDLESQVSTDEVQEIVLVHQMGYIDVSAQSGEQFESLCDIVAVRLAGCL